MSSRKYYTLFLTACLLSHLFSFAQSSKAKQEFYSIKIYSYKTADQEATLDTYLQKAYIPAAHKAGIKHVGAFKPLSNDTASDKRLYVIIPLSSADQLLTLTSQLDKNAIYQQAGDGYINAVYNNPPYARFETILLQAFKTAPAMQLPQLKAPLADRVYELRSYEAATEKIYRNKVHMFNEGGEVPLFKRLNFNAVFYADVISGSHMPNLMYMTSFENMQDRDAHWDTFRNDAEWKTLSAKPEYQKNVSRSEIILMKAAPYSDY